MENKLLLEEIKRFKLLSGYDSKKTESENIRFLNEGGEGEIRGLLKALEDVRALGELRSAEASIMRDIAGEIRVGGKELKTTKEVIEALRQGKLAETEVASFVHSMLQNSREGGTLNKATIEHLASQKKTIEYASKFKNAEELKASILKNPKNTKMSEKTAEDLANKIIEIRDAKEAEAIKNAKEAELGKNTKEIEKSKTEREIERSKTEREIEKSKTEREIESSKEQRRKQDTKNQREREAERFQTEKEKIDLESERILRQTDAEAKQAMAKTERINAEAKELRTKQEMVEAEIKLMKEKEALAELRNSKPNVVLHWLKTNRFVNFMKKIILNKWVWILGGGALVGYWAWNKFFKDNGIKVECEEGKAIDPKTGDCVDKSKIDGDEDGQSENGEIPGTGGSNTPGTGGSNTPGTGGSNGSSSGGSEDGVNDGITYRNCSGTYSIGCKDLPGMDTIKQIQKCLGVKQTGKFGKNTERELESATGEKTINRGGIALICGNF